MGTEESDTLAKADSGTKTLDPRTPWWVGIGFKAVSMLGIPALMLGYYAWKDYKFEDRRIEIQRQQIAAQERTNILLERFEKVLWRVERKLPEGDK